MTPDQALDALAEHYGILPAFHDLAGIERPTSAETKRALLRANGLETDNASALLEQWRDLQAQAKTRLLPSEIIVTAGKSGPDLPQANWQLTLEDGETVEGRGALPALPMGVHGLALQNAGTTENITIIAAPAAAPSIEDLTGTSKLWGLTGALYGLCSQRNQGLGDFEDYARASCDAAGFGAGFFGINPIHSLGWSAEDTISPYSPSHRGFLNALHIAAERIPGLETSGKAHGILAARSEVIATLTSSDLIDYAAFRRHFNPLLEALFAAFLEEASDTARTDFNSYIADQGASLADFALYEALSERHGPDWRLWPENLRAPTQTGIPEARRALTSRIAFHGWLQWVAARQLSVAQARMQASGMALGCYLDLAVGPRRGGAEAWCEGDSIARQVSIGAPPDHLAPGGQNWDLAGYAPQRLAATRYDALRRVLRQSMAAAGMLRIDHVLGLNRSYWIPDDGSPGGYIRQPFQSLLAVAAIEATRLQTAIVGEDLGLVPNGFREETRGRGFYGYSVMQYEKDGHGNFRAPDQLHPQSLACFGTHDTPTLQGYLQGQDINWWEKLGWIDAEKADRDRQSRRQDTARLLGPGEETREPAVAMGKVTAALASSPVAMVSIQLDDLAGLVEAQNLPGTIDEHPNWRRRMPIMVEEFADWQALADAGKLMQDCGRGTCSATKTEKPK